MRRPRVAMVRGDVHIKPAAGRATKRLPETDRPGPAMRTVTGPGPSSDSCRRGPLGQIADPGSGLQFVFLVKLEDFLDVQARGFERGNAFIVADMPGARIVSGQGQLDIPIESIQQGTEVSYATVYIFMGIVNILHPQSLGR